MPRLIPGLAASRWVLALASVVSFVLIFLDKQQAIWLLKKPMLLVGYGAATLVRKWPGTLCLLGVLAASLWFGTPAPSSSDNDTEIALYGIPGAAVEVPTAGDFDPSEEKLQSASATIQASCPYASALRIAQIRVPAGTVRRTNAAL